MAAGLVLPAVGGAAFQTRTMGYEVELQAIEDYRSFAALTIQRFYRGWIVRLHRAREEASWLQQQQSGAAQRAAAARQYAAARTIQDSWRSRRHKRIYRFFRDLIHFREACDPRQLLRCFNAAEAALVEPAAGLHIRFRLGGTSFPPVLLYKIFTHRPVTDICAFGPRNYAAEAVSSTPAAGASGALLQAAPATATTATASSGSSSSGAGRSSSRRPTGWYRRDDRNGWRPVVELQQLPGEPPLPPELPLSISSGGDGGGRGTQQRSTLHSGSRAGHRGCKVSRRCRVRAARRQDAGQPADAPGYCSDSGLPRPGAEHGTTGAGNEPAGGQRQQHAHRKRSSSCGHDGLYHHSPDVRRSERAARLKQRRRCWLLQMYHAGMQAVQPAGSSNQAGPHVSSGGSSQAVPEVVVQQHQQLQLPGAAAASSCRRSDREEELLRELERQLLLPLAGGAGGRDGGCSRSNSTGTPADAAAFSGDAWDAEQLVALGLDAGLLSWALRLDFDSYQAQWLSTAVSLPSDTVKPV